MSYNLLLYGATGYTGRLIAAEGQSAGMSRQEPRGDCRMILAGRDGPALSRIARDRSMDFRVFALDDPSAMRRGLDAVDVVINAAGPFAFTAEPLVSAALEVGCHYVDINGEVDVYLKLKDLASKNAKKNVAIVSGAGMSAAASDVLFDLALQSLLREQPTPRSLNAVRIAHSSVMDVSRGGAVTAARLLRDSVVVVRVGPGDGAGDCCKPSGQMAIRYEPVGKLEHAFDFGRPEACAARIASAVSAIDTITAKYTAERRGLTARAILSYLQMGTVCRFAYQIAATLSPLCRFSHLRGLTQAQLGLAPDGPTRKERDEERHAIVLEIDDMFGSRVLQWRMETPNVYQLAAQLAVGTAKAVAHREGADRMGWVTPADALGLGGIGDDPLRNCTLDRLTG